MPFMGPCRSRGFLTSPRVGAESLIESARIRIPTPLGFDLPTTSATGRRSAEFPAARGFDLRGQADHPSEPLRIDLGLGSPARRVVPPSSAPGTRGVASPPGPSSDGNDRFLPRPYRTTVEDAPDGARPWSWSGGRVDRGCGRPPRVFLPRARPSKRTSVEFSPSTRGGGGLTDCPRSRDQ